MNTASPLSESLRDILLTPKRGVVGLVDELLAACRSHGLRLNWEGDRCQVRSVGNGLAETIDVAIKKSIFRAILARVAALCNEHTPNSVSPYGGQGELSVGTDPQTMYRVTFANTPEEQWMELMQP